MIFYLIVSIVVKIADFCVLLDEIYVYTIKLEEMERGIIDCT